MADEPTRARAAADTWEVYWDSSLGDGRARAVRSLARMGLVPKGAHLAASLVRREVQRIRGRKVLDAGAGTGLASIPLARAGAVVTLLDASPSALRLAGDVYRARRIAADLVQGSILDLPFADKAFDVTWNTGVLEHFSPPEQRAALVEMLRVTRPDGVVVSINPCATAPIYNRLKAAAIAKGTWDVGYEEPIASLSDVCPTGISLREYETAWLAQLGFVKYLLPPPLRLPYVALHEATQWLAPWLNRQPGYLLVSVLRRSSSALPG